MAPNRPYPALLIATVDAPASIPCWGRDSTCGGASPPVISDIYNWLTERFDTADLKDAKAPLEELTNWLSEWRNLTTFDDGVPPF